MARTDRDTAFHETTRRVHKDYDRDQLVEIAEGLKRAERDYAAEREAEKERQEKEYVKPLRHARSKAELTRVRQGWVLITLAATQLAGTATLILSQVFHVF